MTSVSTVLPTNSRNFVDAKPFHLIRRRCLSPNYVVTSKKRHVRFSNFSHRRTHTQYNAGLYDRTRNRTKSVRTARSYRNSRKITVFAKYHEKQLGITRHYRQHSRPGIAGKNCSQTSQPDITARHYIQISQPDITARHHSQILQPDITDRHQGQISQPGITDRHHTRNDTLTRTSCPVSSVPPHPSSNRRLLPVPTWPSCHPRSCPCHHLRDSSLHRCPIAFLPNAQHASKFECRGQKFYIRSKCILNKRHNNIGKEQSRE